MDTFLGSLAQFLKNTQADNMDQLTVIFPNRRAGLFFLQKLAHLYEQPTWSPEVLSIEEFIQRAATVEIPDRLTLLAELYQVYLAFEPNQTFDRFYDWGEMLLSDFDEVDSWFAPIDELFRHIHEYAEVDSAFLNDAEALHSFVSSFEDVDESHLLQLDFQRIWSHVSEAYRQFRSLLLQKGWAYSGLAQRLLAEAPQNSEYLNGNRRFVFAGFHVFSRSVQKTIEWLAEQGRGECFWDLDPYYFNNHRQEAGLHLRRMAKTPLFKPAEKWLEPKLAANQKNVETIGVPLQVGQAKAAGQIIENLFIQNEKDIQDNATKPKEERVEKLRLEDNVIILPNNALLFPMLSAVPDSVARINVTMGYAFSQTPLFQFFELIGEMQANSRLQNKKEVFYFRDVFHVLENAYLTRNHGSILRPLLHSIAKSGLFWIDKEDLVYFLPEGETLPEIVSFIFSRKTEAPDYLEYVRTLCDKIRLENRAEVPVEKVEEPIDSKEEQPEPETQPAEVEQDFFYHFYTRLNRLDDLLKQNELKISLATFRRLFRQLLKNTRLPFTGEPLNGLQIMGMIESQALDFKNVIILSANEDILPTAVRQNSFIPFNLRRAFGLPIPQDDDASQAYFFYRLLQRAEKAYILYNTVVSDGSGKEKSRFLLQMQYEWPNALPNVQIKESYLQAPSGLPKTQSITVEKTPAVMALLEKFKFTPEKAPEEIKLLSPTAIGAYIDCKLKFYFNHCAELYENEANTDEVDALVFGNLTHKTLQFLYADYAPGEKHPEGATLTASEIEWLKTKISPAIDRAFRSVYDAKMINVQGFNIVVKKLVEETVVKFLDQDMKKTPFKMLGVENRMENRFNVSPELSVKLGGKTDRITEQANHSIEILDYKTGKVDWPVKLSTEHWFSSEKKNDKVLQAAYYVYLAQMNNPAKNYQFVFYTPQGKETAKTLLPFDQYSTEDFANGLKTIILELYNPQIAFSQTDDEKKCAYCPYARLCNR